MPTLLIASRNAHKAEEIAAILGDDFTVQTLAKFPAAPEVVEDGDTFAANAVKKATEIAAWLGGQARPDFVLADDSGLEVDALDGAPGVHSARYAGGESNAPDDANNAKLLRELADVPDGNRVRNFTVCWRWSRLAKRRKSGRSRAFVEVELPKRRSAKAASATIRYSFRTATNSASPSLAAR